MLDTDLVLGPHTTALIGLDGGRYPAGNTVLVQGADATAIIDPSTSMRVRGDLGDLPTVDRVVLTHAHEDHLGAVQYLWNRLRCPVWATPFAASLLRRKLSEAQFHEDIGLTVVPLDARFGCARQVVRGWRHPGDALGASPGKL